MSHFSWEKLKTTNDQNDQRPASDERAQLAINNVPSELNANTGEKNNRARKQSIIPCGLSENLIDHYKSMTGFFRPLALVYSLMTQGSRKFRAFSVEQWLPPLPKTQPSSQYGHAIPVLYTNDPRSVSKWIDENISSDGSPVAVGWDVESSPNLPWRKASYVGPATVQISVVDASLVLQIAQEDVGAFEEALPVLQEFLADSTIVKAGVGIDQDMIELFRWKSSSFTSPLTDARSRLDIGGIGGSVGGGRTSSLKNLAKAVLSVDLPKSKKLAMSNWAKVPLTKDQVTYAARDAWAAAAILYELERRDPKTYSTASLLELVLADECPIDKLNARAVARKEAKTKVLEIMGSGDEKVNRKDLSEDKLKEVEQLEQEMKELAPPRPTVFNVGPLGLAL